MEFSNNLELAVPIGEVRHTLNFEGRGRLQPLTAICLVATVLVFLAGRRVFAGHANSASVIIISVDTLRADRLSSYGYRGYPTPHIDAIAKGGTLFSAISSQVPLTLPSHTVLLTSTYPFANGVEDNGDEVPAHTITLARVLRSRGYRTAAFIGGFILDKRFGLNQGFGFYDSPFDLHKEVGSDPGDVKRLGGEVVGSAIQWLQNNRDGPFFVFMHLYDLHPPYNLPAPYRVSFGTGYEAELRYVDKEIGRFWSYLDQNALLKNTLVVFTADHGESLGEHGEETHGYFIYQSTLWVPLIFHCPAESKLSFPSRINTPAGLVDVAPTILEFLGIKPPPQFQGKSLLGWLSGEKPRMGEVYSESLYAHYHYGCAALRSLRVQNYKYIDAPEPELYDLATDPAERINLYARMKPRAMAYNERLQHLLVRYASLHRAQTTAVSPDVAQALSSLSYVAATSSYYADADSGPDPKSRLDDYQKTEEAETLSFAGRWPQAVELLKKVLAKNPDLIDTRNLLGLFQEREKHPKEAAENFIKVLDHDPSNLMAHYNLGLLYFQLHRLDDAARELQATLAISYPQGAAATNFTRSSEEMLGKIWLEKKDPVRARNQYNHLLRAFPRDFAAHYNLGWIAAEQRNWPEATRQLRAALEIEPKNPLAHNALGTIYFQQGNLAEARVEFSTAIKLDPDFAQGHYDLGLVLSKINLQKEAVGEFRKAAELDPKFLAARRALEEMH